MALPILRKALHILVTVMAVIFLIIGASTRFSAEAMSLDMAAFIRVTGPLLIGLILSAGLLEVAREAHAQP